MRSTRLRVYPILALALALAAVLRLLHLREWPGWYVDEGTYLTLIAHLLNGRVELDALPATFCAPRLTQPPGLFLAAAGVAWLPGLDIVLVRGLSALSGLLTLWLLYRLAARFVIPANHGGRWLGLLAVGIGATHLPGVVIHRCIFTYTPGTALILACCYWLARHWHGKQQRHLLWAAAAAGLAVVTTYHAAGLLPLVIVAAWQHARWNAWRAAALALGPLALFALAMLAWQPSLFMSDVKDYLAYSGLGRGPLAIAESFYRLATFDHVCALGLAGLVLMPWRRQGGWGGMAMLLALALPALFLLLLNPTDGVYFHTLVVALPWLYLGWAVLAWRLLHLMRRLRPAWLPPALIGLAALAVALAQGLPLLGTIMHLGEQPRMFRQAAIFQPDEADAVAAWINRRVAPTDYVIGPTVLNWALHCRTTGYAVPAVREGAKNRFYPRGLPRNHLSFDPDPRAARYVVRSPLEWIDPGADALLNALESEGWTVVFQAGSFSVLGPPDGSPATGSDRP